MKIVGGTRQDSLTLNICNYINTSPVAIDIKNFTDGELYVRLLDSVRGQDIYLIFSMEQEKVNDNLIELAMVIDALRRSSAKSVNLIMPYHPYSRADRKVQPRESLGCKVIARLIETMGVDRLISVDLHSSQIQGFYDIPVDNLHASDIICEYLLNKRIEDCVVVSPDVGGVSRARVFCSKLGDAPMAIIDKNRSEHNKAKAVNLIGDVNGKNAIIVDDIVDTGGTIVAATQLLLEHGAKSVRVAATHGLFSQNGLYKVLNSGIEELIVTDTIYQKESYSGIFTELSIAPTLAKAIDCLYNGTSIQQNIFRQ